MLPTNPNMQGSLYSLYTAVVPMCNIVYHYDASSLVERVGVCRLTWSSHNYWYQGLFKLVQYY